RKRIGRSHVLAGPQTSDDFHQSIVSAANDDCPLFESVSRSYEHDFFAADGLDSASGYGDGNGLFLDRNRGADERPRAPNLLAVGDLGYHARRARLLVQKRTDKHDIAVRLLLDSARRDRNRLAFLDDGQIGRTDREVDPNPLEIHDHE